MYTEIVKSDLKSIPLSIHPSKELSRLRFHELGYAFCEMHIHDEMELLKAVRGNIGIRIAGRDHELQEGEIVLIKSRIPHQTFAASNYSTHELIQFRPDLLTDSDLPHTVRYLSRFINSGDLYIFRKNNQALDELGRYMDTIINEYKNKHDSWELFVKANLYLILGCFYRSGALNNTDNFFNPHEIGKILPLLKYIDDNYAEPISLEQAGRILNLNRDYFCRLFKKATNMTFTDYLNFVRICHTEKLLTYSDKSISEISLDAGFSSVSYFNRVFKKYKLVTPSEYRRSKYAED